MKIVIFEQKESDFLHQFLKKCGVECYIGRDLQDVHSIVARERHCVLLISLEMFESLEVSEVIALKAIDKKFSILVVAREKTKKEIEISVLNNGADDYVDDLMKDSSQKFADVFLARIEARLRSGGTNVIEIDDLIIDPDEEKILYFSKEIELKGKPFEVLTHLAKQRGQIVSKEQLLDAIWEEPELVTPNVIEVAINQIRQKMDKPLGIGTIETVRRRGYRFCFPNCNKESTMVDA